MDYQPTPTTKTPSPTMSFYTLHPYFRLHPQRLGHRPFPFPFPFEPCPELVVYFYIILFFFCPSFQRYTFFWGGWRDGNRMKHPPRHSSTHVTPQYPPYSLLPNLDLGRDRNHLTDVQGRVGRGLYMDQGWVVGEHSWCCPLFVCRFYHRPCLQYRSVPPPPVWGTSPSLLLVNTLTTGYGEKGERT